ncbi:hypothetical protein GM418_23660 [Maribellus comscasis]|uniref:Outer membrane protein beta-barrel domain-containing protein n=1 Tax=Maribellus comscasis TaxID=2681766 RepID=A0A6I6JZF4_9BACT|nr:hypothetical protein [Maribellus comscasis]QGY46548.1 hypothetical protein GM418_23660 [Maribellus comscasis]
MKYRLTIYLLLSLVLNGRAQSDPVSDIRITGEFVVSQMMTEFQKGFAGSVNEFDNQPGIGFGLEISKQFTKNWEVGAGFTLSTLNGEATSPEFSATGFHSSMMEPFAEPVVYKSQLFSPKIYVQYNFVLRSHYNITNPFIRAGVGYVPYRSQLRYRDNWHSGVIFGKGVEEYENNKMSTAVYTITPGIRTKISKHVELLAAVNLNIVNYDFLDVVHNYSAEGERLQMIGVYADFMIGVSFLLNDSGRFDKITQKKHRKGKIRDFLPFYKQR